MFVGFVKEIEGESMSMNPIEDKRPDERLGAYLARAREERGMTLSDLATATKLTEKNVQLIESGDWKAFPVQAYVRSYLNSISNKLGLDNKRVLDWYSGEIGSKFASLLSDGPEKLGVSGGESKPKGKLVIVIMIVIVLALVVASKFLKETTPVIVSHEDAKTQAVEEDIQEVGEMPEGAEIVPVDSLASDSITDTLKVEPKNQEKPISQAVVDDAIKKSDLPASATIFLSSDSKKEVVPQKAKTRIQLIASGEMRSWIGIKHREEDTEFLKESNLSKAGTHMVYESMDSLYVVVGEPRAISKMILNGVVTPLPGIKFGRVSKFTLFGGKVVSEGGSDAQSGN